MIQPTGRMLPTLLQNGPWNTLLPFSSLFVHLEGGDLPPQPTKPLGAGLPSHVMFPPRGAVKFRAGHVCSHISHISALCWKCTLLSSFLILPTKFLIPLLCSRLDFVSSRKLFLTPGTGCETPSLSSHGTLTLIPSHPPHALWLSCLSSISR